jgi:hypothetical protein
MQEDIKYMNAFECQVCPQSNGVHGCPCWTELVETNLQTGQERITKNCIFQLLPHMLVEVIKASNRPAAEIGAMRQEVVEGVAKLANTAVQKITHNA